MNYRFYSTPEIFYSLHPQLLKCYVVKTCNLHKKIHFNSIWSYKIRHLLYWCSHCNVSVKPAKKRWEESAFVASHWMMKYNISMCMSVILNFPHRFSEILTFICNNGLRALQYEEKAVGDDDIIWGFWRKVSVRELGGCEVMQCHVLVINKYKDASKGHSSVNDW